MRAEGQLDQDVPRQGPAEIQLEILLEQRKKAKDEALKSQNNRQLAQIQSVDEVFILKERRQKATNERIASEIQLAIEKKKYFDMFGKEWSESP